MSKILASLLDLIQPGCIQSTNIILNVPTLGEPEKTSQSLVVLGPLGKKKKKKKTFRYKVGKSIQ